ncbi:MAG: hypothetical protein J6Q32_00825 [Clostridia bacterium]|nr:hypothetical protein [Clostridia bacterium]
MNNSTLDIIKTIIDKQMNMPTDRVWAYNGTQNLPQDTGLFIVLSFMNRDPYANVSRYEPTQNGYIEKQSVNVAEDVLISLISVNTDARDRVFEVPMALKSAFSQYIQEKNHVHISTIGQVMDSSFMEATSRLNRFDVTCRVIRTYEQIIDIDYYDKFPNTSKFEPNWLID